MYVIRNAQVKNLTKVLNFDIENKILCVKVKTENLSKVKGIILRSTFNLGGVYKGATSICVIDKNNQFNKYRLWFNPETSYTEETIDDFYSKLYISLISVEKLNEPS